MSQFDFGDLSSPLSGAQLINDNLEPWRDALNSLHSGAARPSYATPGLMWLDNSTTPWSLKMFQGSSDIILGSLDSTTLNFTPSAVDGATVTGLLASNVSATDTNTTGSTTVQGQLDYATKNATQVVAEAGTNNTDRMTALSTRQSIERFGYIPVNASNTISNPNSISSFTMPYDGEVVIFGVTTSTGGYFDLNMWSNTFAVQANSPFPMGNTLATNFSAPSGTVVTIGSKFQAQINTIRVFKLKKDI